MGLRKAVIACGVMMHVWYLSCANCTTLQNGYQGSPDDIRHMNICHDTILHKIMTDKLLEPFEENHLQVLK